MSKPATASHDATEARVYVAQISLLLRSATSGAIASALVSLLYAYILWPHVARDAIVAWIVATNAINLARVLVARAYSARPRERASARRWGLLYSALMLASGALWGAAGTVLFPTDRTDLYFVSAFILIGMPAGAIASLAAYWPAYAVYLCACVLPFALRLLVTGETAMVTTGLAALVFTSLLLAVSRRIEAMIRENLMQRYEIAALADGLAEARDAAEGASRAKSRFLANMSHEVRTPMNAILGMLELMLRTPLDARQQELAATMNRAARALLAIVNDILDLSRVEAGRLDLVRAAFDPRTPVAEACELFTVEAQRKGIALTVEVQPDVPAALIGDAGRLRQVLINLIGNAVKFTERGSIRVSVGAVPDAASAAQALPPSGPIHRLRWAVQDTGIGIEPAALGRIFDAFAQADESDARRHGGAGLGLAIARQLVELMGGKLEVETQPGMGSTFRFVLALARSDVAPAPPERAPAACAPPADAIGVGAHVLLAEDNPVNQAVAKAMLESFGCRVTIAADGRAAVDAVARERPDLVLMDCQMPGVDGFEATRRLRALEASGGPRLPIVALTANAMAEDRARCLAAGMDDFLSKPYSRAAIQSVVARHVPAACAAETPTKSAAAPASSVEDESAALRGLMELFDGDRAEVEAMVRGYLQNTDTLIRTMRACAGSDRAALARAAHSLKSTSARFAAHRVCELARNIESSAGTATAAEIASLIDVLELEQRERARALLAGLKLLATHGMEPGVPGGN